jgi:hypothetical protein
MLLTKVIASLWVIELGLGPKRPPGFVPQGLNDRSQAIHCLEYRKPGGPSRRDGMIDSFRLQFGRRGFQPFGTGVKGTEKDLTVILMRLILIRINENPPFISL